jgi:hypothetical protein
MHQTGSVDHFATSSLKTSEELKETTTKDSIKTKLIETRIQKKHKVKHKIRRK